MSGSMNAQNGSADSNGQYQSTYPPTYRDADGPEDGEEHREEYREEYRDEGSSAVDYDRSRRNGGGYHNPPPRNPSSWQCAGHHQDYTSQTYYFPSDQTYAQQPIRYDRNLAFDEDQNGTPTNPRYTGRPTHYDDGYDPQQTTAQGHYNTYGNGHRNTQHSETTQRWSTEISPEERLRLGLTRFENEEQRRLAYENAGVQYDQDQQQQQQQQQQHDNNTQQ